MKTGIYNGVDLFINKKEWRSYSTKQLEEYKKNLFDYYRSIGFPFFPTDNNYRNTGFKKLKSFDYTTIINGDIIRQTMHGLGLAWSFMPHAPKIQCGNMKTPYDVFHDDKQFKEVITKRLQMGDNMSHNGIRKMLKMYSGTQSVSNFRPTAAAAIYDKFAKNGLVWDMSSGYGGRLLGAIISGTNYIGTEPATLTFNGLCEINNMFGSDDIALHKMGSEVFLPEKNSLDLCFTSPPYFDWEKYSDEGTQSYMKYPTKEKWKKNFLGKTFRRCHYGLKEDKYMIINIANTKNYVTLESDMIEVAKKNGFKLERIMKLALSNPSFKMAKCAFKYEPVFVFKRK